MIQTPVAIIGMAKSGESARRYLLARGLKEEEILTFDQKAPAQFSKPQDLFKDGKPKTLIVSPGVPLKTPWIEEARKNGIHITSEINLACEILQDEKIIGVTGSLGKSTTVSLLGAGLSAFDKNAFVGGNLGTPFCDYARGILTGQRERSQWIVLELSSYQLENSENLKLNHSAITFLSTNHMERYSSLDEYYLTKWRMIDQTSGTIFLNKRGGDLESFAAKQEEFPRCQLVSREDKNLVPYNLSNCLLLGSHNQDNMALAAQIALHCHWPISSIQKMKEFQGLEHRLENVGVIQGVRFINDSKATALDSVLTATQVAHEYLKNSGRLHLLIGGRNKNLPWEQISTLGLLDHTNFLFFGECRDIAQEKSQLRGNKFPHLDEALCHLFPILKPNDIVLLSPGGTSLDEFKGFEERGNFFKNKIKEYYSNKS